MKIEKPLLTKITVRGDAVTETIPTDVIYRKTVWGLMGVVWDAENAEFICTYEQTDVDPVVSNELTGQVQEIDNVLYFK